MGSDYASVILIYPCAGAIGFVYLYLEEYKSCEVPAEGMQETAAGHEFRLCITSKTPAQELMGFVYLY